jgi:hypothetical protein
MSDDHSLELVIGGQPHLRCTADGCSFRYNFLGKTTKIPVSLMHLVEDAHQQAWPPYEQAMP